MLHGHRRVCVDPFGRDGSVKCTPIAYSRIIYILPTAQMMHLLFYFIIIVIISH